METNKRRLKSSTLIEIIVAMIIANIVFFFCFSIIMGALSGNKMMKEFKAETVGSNFIVGEKIRRKLKDESFEYGDLTLIKTVEPDENVVNLYRLTIQVTDIDGRILSETKCFVCNEKD